VGEQATVPPSRSRRIVRNRVTQREGGLLLWLVLATLLALLFWAFSRGLIVSTVRTDTQALIEARVCQLLANSAIAEAEARMGVIVNDSGCVAAARLRQQLIGTSQGDLDLRPWIDLPETSALLSVPFCRRYSLEELRCRLFFQSPLDKLPYEKRGLVVVTATVRSPGAIRSVRRRVELARSLKTTLVTVPRPFGKYGFVLFDTTGLTDVAQVERCRDQAANLARKVIRTLKELRDRSAISSRPQWEELVAAAFDPDAPGERPTPFSLPSGSILYGMVWNGPANVLERLDLARHLRKLLDKAETAVARLPTLASRKGTLDGASQEKSLQEARQISNSVRAIPLEVKTFRDDLVTLPPDGSESYSSLKKQTEKLSCEYFRRRIHYEINPQKTPDEIQSQFRRLVSDRLNGVVWVNNGRGQPLTLSGQIRGKLIVAAGPGGVHIRDLNGPSREDDLITVYVRSGTVRLSGKSRVTVLMGPPSDGEDAPRLEIDPAAEIFGSLVLAQVPPGMVWQGSLNRDEGQFSGYTDKNGENHGVFSAFFVGLSPRILYRRVVGL